MFRIYKFEYDNDFISRDELRSYIDMGLITQDEFQEIAGEAYVAPQAQPAQPQA